jgi:CheY-like chemotaxis protein
MGQAPRRILVVDDSDEVREFFQFALEQAGYTVETAQDGEDALAKVLRARPDLIVLDVVMPRMDGLDLLLKLRSDLAPPVPPAVLVSGFDLTEAEALRRGAARFLHKPVDARDLLGAVADVLSGRTARQEAIDRARDHSSAARKEARENAMHLLNEIDVHTPPGMPFPQHAARLVSFVGHYLAVDAVAAAILRDDRLLVLASSTAPLIAPDLDRGAAFPSVQRVLESGSSLVLPDLATHPSFASCAERLDDVHCLIAVPIRFAGSAVGVLCVFQSCRCAVEAEDLALVQLFSSRGTSVLHAWVNGRSDDELPLRIGPGVAPRRIFERALDLELRLLRERGGSLELAILSEVDLEAIRAQVEGAAHPARLLAGALGDRRVAVYKRSAPGDARAKLTAVIAPLREPDRVHTGIVDLASGAFSSLHADALLSLAEQALDEAVESATPMRRMIVDVQTT